MWALKIFFHTDVASFFTYNEVSVGSLWMKFLSNLFPSSEKYFFIINYVRPAVWAWKMLQNEFRHIWMYKNRKIFSPLWPASKLFEYKIFSTKLSQITSIN